MSFAMLAILLCVGCYLIGAIPFGYLIGLSRGIDIRQLGSGNTGATNVGRVLGKRWAVGVFLLDAMKGFGPTLAAGLMIRTHPSLPDTSDLTEQLSWLGAGMCCVLGHSFPVYLKFNGGKGVATSLGVILGIYPYMSLAGMLAFVVWLVVLRFSRTVSLASMVAAISLPIFVTGCMFWRGFDVVRDNASMIAFAILIAGIVLYRHRGNMARLRDGTESRIGGHHHDTNSP